MANLPKIYLPFFVERHFPFLTRNDYEVKSKADVFYNCIAFAAGEHDRWWEPDPGGVYYWPLKEREYTVENYVRAFESIGYKKCNDPNYEDGFVKVAIYYTLLGNPEAPPGSPTHAALQLDREKWASKLGPWHDIEHVNLHCLNGEDSTGITRPYGQPVQFLKLDIKSRRRRPAK
jgi:hypothetical protein